MLHDVKVGARRIMGCRYNMSSVCVCVCVCVCVEVWKAFIFAPLLMLFTRVDC